MSRETLTRLTGEPSVRVVPFFFGGDFFAPFVGVFLIILSLSGAAHATHRNPKKGTNPPLI